jgi:hypothetical protein
MWSRAIVLPVTTTSAKVESYFLRLLLNVSLTTVGEFLVLPQSSLTQGVTSTSSGSIQRWTEFVMGGTRMSSGSIAQWRESSRLARVCIWFEMTASWGGRVWSAHMRVQTRLADVDITIQISRVSGKMLNALLAYSRRGGGYWIMVCSIMTWNFVRWSSPSVVNCTICCLMLSKTMGFVVYMWGVDEVLPVKWWIVVGRPRNHDCQVHGRDLYCKD